MLVKGEAVWLKDACPSQSSGKLSESRLVNDEAACQWQAQGLATCPSQGMLVNGKSSKPRLMLVMASCPR